MKTLLRLVAALGLLPCAATAVLFTNSTLINPSDATYDGQDIIVSNATLTVDGPHAFASLRVESGGVLTHSASPSGSITLTNRFADEPQLLVGTNDVTLANSNVVAATVVVTDASGTVTYTNNTDYLVTVVGAQGFVRRTDTSAIPDGALVLITYDATGGTVASGLTLTVTNAFTVAVGGVIDVAGRGNSGAFGVGRGLNAGIPASGSGGGHGGMGGQSSSNAPGGIAFGSLDAPATLGCGGGAGVGGAGGAGGGLARLVCGTTFTVDGLINAKGDAATNSRAGGGSGGGVWITATNFTGAGSILADGGVGEPIHGGGGGGGRIMVEFRTNTFTGSLLARGAAGWQAGGAGTIFVRTLGQLGVVTVDNGGMLGGAGTPVSVTLNPDVIVQGGATVLQSGSQTVGNLIVRSNSTVLTSVTNNASMSFIIASNLIIEATAKLSVSGRGSFPSSGTGVGQVSSFVGAGAGHGGGGGNGSIGANTNALGGGIYGSMSNPQSQGSGGRTIGSYIGGMGGGVMRLIVTRNTQLDGEITADASPGLNDRAGGGSGGSVWITTGGFSGNGKVSANGGAGGLPYGGGGAGGRVAIFYTASNNFNGVFSARGGAGAMAGGAGSIYVKSNAAPTADLIFDNGGLSGARTLLSEGNSFKGLIVSGGAILSVSNSASTFFSSILVGSNSTLIPGFTTQTFSVSSNVMVEAGGLISVDGLAANNNIVGSGGGGHGGAGGRGATSLGSTGILDNAASPNSVGGSGGYGLTSSSGFGRGGGVLTMNITRVLLLDGRISANGTDASTNFAGGGAGGSIALTLGGFIGSGQIVSDGGSGFLPNGGGGGGGRIAVTCNAQTNTFTGSFSTKGGNGYQRGGAGTVYFNPGRFKNIPDIFVDNGGAPGTNTVITASGIGSYNLEIRGGGWVSSASGASLYSLTVRSNSWFAVPGNFNLSGDVTLEAGGGINLNGVSSTGSGNGNTSLKGGGGHGGFGGGNSDGNVYGSIVSPQSVGSIGGGSGSSFPPFGGWGGGALRLTVSGTTHVDGRISADGGNGDAGAGGGSGGSVWLTLNRFTGNGAISAAGGAGVPALGLGSGGGGGRIAITWNSNSFTGPIVAPGGSGVVGGGAGTVYLKANNQPAAALIVDNAGLFGTNTPLSSTFAMPTGLFDLTVGGGARTYFSTTPALLSNLTIAANGILMAPSSSAHTLTVLGNFAINSGGSVNANGRGSGRGVGTAPGGSLSSKGAGGGHGGAGGASASGALGGTNYGSSTQPVALGSGGGAGANVYTTGCEGGGALKLTVVGTATINGNLSANGNAGLQDDSGGGAGGSIWVFAKSIAGSGVIAADGGDGELYGGGGGGAGRIALYANSTNGFTGIVSVLGGDGANAGQNGTIVFTTNMFPFNLTSSSPSGLISNTVPAVTFNFDQLVDATTVSPALFSLAMPSNYAGPFPTLGTTVSGASVTLNASPALNVPGDYAIIVTPVITDIFGTPMAQAYTNTFTVAVPTVEGFVRDTNGTGIAGVTLQTPGYLPAITDVTGSYALGVPPGWSGTITPSLGANMFVPGSITLVNVTSQTTNQNFLMVDTIAPAVSSGVSGTNLFFNWPGFSGVTYQAYWSTNLVDWLPWGSPLPGTNAAMQLEFPIDTDAQGYFRLGAAN